MKRVVSAEEMRRFEQMRFADGRARSLDWMERAAEGVDALLSARYPGKRVLAICGGGNNGGDGYVLARFAQAAGMSATVLAPAPALSLRGDALRACEDFRTSGGRISSYEPALLGTCDVIVDALLGTGLTDTVRAELARIAVLSPAVPLYSVAHAARVGARSVWPCSGAASCGRLALRGFARLRDGCRWRKRAGRDRGRAPIRAGRPNRAAGAVARRRGRLLARPRRARLVDARAGPGTRPDHAGGTRPPSVPVSRGRYQRRRCVAGPGRAVAVAPRTTG